MHLFLDSTCFASWVSSSTLTKLVGDIPTLVAHLRDDHKVDMHSGCTFNHRYVKSYTKNFSYSLEVGANGRKMIWQGVPRSIRDSQLFRETWHYSFQVAIGRN